MTDFVDWMEEAIQSYVFNGDSFPAPPSSLYIALHDGDPGDSGTANELSLAGYVPEETSLSIWTKIGGPSPTVYTNDEEIEFVVAGEDWHGISHVSIRMGESPSSNVIYEYAMTDSVDVDEGQRLVFDPETVTVEVD